MTAKTTPTKPASAKTMPAKTAPVWAQPHAARIDTSGGATFPPAKLLPDAAKAALEPLWVLRERHADAQEAEATARHALNAARLADAASLKELSPRVARLGISPRPPQTLSRALPLPRLTCALSASSWPGSYTPPCSTCSGATRTAAAWLSRP